MRNIHVSPEANTHHAQLTGLKCAVSRTVRRLPPPRAARTYHYQRRRDPLREAVVGPLIVVFGRGRLRMCGGVIFRLAMAPARPPRLISAVVVGDRGRPVNLPSPRRLSFCPVFLSLSLPVGERRNNRLERPHIAGKYAEIAPGGSIGSLKCVVSLCAGHIGSDIHSVAVGIKTGAAGGLGGRLMRLGRPPAADW